MKKVFKRVVALAVAMLMICASMAFVAAEEDKVLKVTFDGGAEPVFGLSTSSLTADQWIGANGSTTDKFTLTVKFKIENLVEGATAATRPITLFTGMTSFRIQGGKLYLTPSTIDYNAAGNIELGDFTYNEWHVLEMTSRQHYHRNGLTVKLDGVTLGGGELMDAANPSAYYWTCQRAAIPQAPLATITHSGNADSHISSLAANDNGYFFGVASWSDAAAGRTDVATYRGMDFLIDYVNLDINSTLEGVPADITEEFTSASVNEGAVSFGEGSTLTLATGTASVGFAVEDFVTDSVEPDPDDPAEPSEPELDLPTPATSMDVTVGSYTASVSADDNGFVSAIANGNNIDIYTFPKAGYVASAYSVDGGEAVPVIGEVLSVPVAANCEIDVTFAAVEAADDPELVVSKITGNDKALKINVNGGYMPTVGFATSTLTVGESLNSGSGMSNAYTLSYKFKIDNQVAGATAAARPIYVFNGINSLHIIGDEIYFAPNNLSWNSGRQLIGTFTYGEWHTVSLYYREHYARSAFKLTYDGTQLYDAYVDSTNGYVHHSACIPQPSLDTIKVNGADMAITAPNGLFLGMSAYSGDTTDTADSTYRGFDFWFDDVAIAYQGSVSKTGFNEDFNDMTISGSDVTLGNAHLSLIQGSAPVTFSADASAKVKGYMHINPSYEGSAEGSGYMPMGGLTSSALSAEQTVDEFDFEIGFQISNMIQGVNTVINPISLANGTNSLSIMRGGIYLSNSTKNNAAQVRSDVYLCPFEEGKHYDVKLHIYKDGDKVLTDAYVNGVRYAKGAEMAYDGITAPTVQSTKSMNTGYFAMPAGGVYFGAAWYGGRDNVVPTDGVTPSDDYNDFDLEIDYINLNFDGVPAGLENDDFTATVASKSWSAFRECIAITGLRVEEAVQSTGVATYGDNVVSVIAKLVPGTVDEFGLILSPTAINGTLTKADLANYYITATSGNTEIYAFPGFAYGTDGRFGVEVNGGTSNYFTAMGKIHAYVYAINETSDVVAYLPVVFE